MADPYFEFGINLEVPVRWAVIYDLRQFIVHGSPIRTADTIIAKRNLDLLGAAILRSDIRIGEQNEARQTAQERRAHELVSDLGSKTVNAKLNGHHGE